MVLFKSIGIIFRNNTSVKTKNMVFNPLNDNKTCLFIGYHIEANSVDPDQTAPTGAVWSEYTLFVEEFSKTFQQRTKAGALMISVDLRSRFSRNART